VALPNYRNYWIDAGVTSPILVPSSTSGGQTKAFAELFDTFSS
jgi:hypothetical protein